MDKVPDELLKNIAEDESIRQFLSKGGVKSALKDELNQVQAFKPAHREMMQKLIEGNICQLDEAELFPDDSDGDGKENVPGGSADPLSSAGGGEAGKEGNGNAMLGTTSSSSSADDSQLPGNHVSAADLIRYVIKCAADSAADEGDTSHMWEEFCVTAYPKKHNNYHLRGDLADHATMIKELEKLVNENKEEGKEFEAKRVGIDWNDEVTSLVPVDKDRNLFDKHRVDQIFSPEKNDRKSLQRFLYRNLLPIPRNIRDGSVVLRDDKDGPVNVEYVQTEPVHAHSFFDAGSTDTDKPYVIVVAGESGSGKSVFACLQAHIKGFLPIYGVMEASDLVNKVTEFPELNEMLRLIITSIDRVDKESRFTKKFVLLKEYLNEGRNAWAEDVFNRKLKSILAPGEVVIDEEDDDETKKKKQKKKDEIAKLAKTVGDEEWRMSRENARNWYTGDWSEDFRPEKVAIVLDEVTDIDLAEGLVSAGRRLRNRHFDNLVKPGGDLLIVLAGTGLDAIRYDGRVGTCSDKSKLVTMVSPKQEVVIQQRPSTPADLGEALETALDEGLFSRILKTNARMFFRSVLPILSLACHQVDDNKLKPAPKKRRLEARLIEVASFRALMDHGPRFYVNQNSVGGLPTDGRNNLLKQAFCYHLRVAMEKARYVMKGRRKELEGTEKKNEKKEGQAVSKKIDCFAKEIAKLQEAQDDSNGVDGNDLGDIFSRGIVSRSGTSNALKYMACFGLTCPLRPSFGDEFEELTALHYMRLKETEGYEVHREVLVHAWPPHRLRQSSKKTTQEQQNTKQEEEDRKAEEELNNLKLPCCREEKKYCVVLSAGSPKAQSGDVLALVVDPSKRVARLDTIQDKHYAAPPSSSVTVAQWWWSLGVELKGGDRSDAVIDDSGAGFSESSAYYSFAGLKQLCEVLTAKLDQQQKGGEKLQVVPGERIMAMSFSVDKTPANFPIPNHRQCRVWFREMFEPTISVLVLSDPEDPPADPLEENPTVSG